MGVWCRTSNGTNSRSWTAESRSRSRLPERTQPFTVVVMLDFSGSMTANLDCSERHRAVHAPDAPG